MDKQPKKIRKVLSIADLRVWLAENMPYFESDDKDEYFYLLRPSDVEKLATNLYCYLRGRFFIGGKKWIDNPNHH